MVVSAGNENSDASQFTPASCRGVITVGATARSGSRASYSNYGSRIDVMAPGGDTNGGILSTVRDDATGTYTYQNYMGTSMAAPHVAGLIALMKHARPDLTPMQTLEIVKRTARSLSLVLCNRPSALDCGAGLVDARSALEAIPKTTPPPLTLEGTRVYTCELRPDGYCERGRIWVVTLSDAVGSSLYAFSGLRRQRHAVFAWKDMNGDDALSDGDMIAEFPSAVIPTTLGVNLRMEPYRASSNAVMETRIIQLLASVR